MITDEINERAYRAACLRPNFEISGSITRGDMRRALTAVLPMIRAEVLEEAAKVADAVSDQSRREIRSALDATEIAAAIRAMKGDQDTA